MKLESVRDLPVGQRFDPILDIGDALKSKRVGAQIRGRSALVDPRRALQPLEEGDHGARVETGTLQYLESHAIRLALGVAGEIELALDQAGLAERQRGFGGSGT